MQIEVKESSWLKVAPVCTDEPTEWAPEVNIQHQIDKLFVCADVAL